MEHKLQVRPFTAWSLALLSVPRAGTLHPTQKPSYMRATRDEHACGAYPRMAHGLMAAVAPFAQACPKQTSTSPRHLCVYALKVSPRHLYV